MATNVEDIYIDLMVLLGTTRMPLHQLLRMGRGAIIELDTDVDDDCEIWANEIPVAKGKVMLEGQSISITITEILTRRPEYREPPGIVHVPKDDESQKGVEKTVVDEHTPVELSEEEPVE